MTPIDSLKYRARFEAGYDRRGDDECWPWLKATTHRHGVTYAEGKVVYASHIALILDGRKRPGEAHALHSCDNPPCVNPKHLRWGTNAENVKEAVERGLMHRGQRTGGSKLTADQVLEIRSSNKSQKELAKIFNVHPSSISYVKSGKSWKYL